MGGSGSAPVVLIVEDEGLLRQMIVYELRAAGWKALEASTGEEALRLLTEVGDRIDIVFTDIQLGGGTNGWYVAEAFRAANPAIPIVYASGTSADRRRRVPGSLFFSKPYMPEEILNACRDLLAE